VASFEIQQEDKFIILASDGVWEFLSNEEVMDINDFKDCESFEISLYVFLGNESDRTLL